MKNKYKLLFVFALVGLLFTTSVSAKEITLDTLDAVISEKYADAKDSAAYLYVIGDYAFSSEHTLTLQDVIYASTHSKHNISEELSNITIYYLQRTSDENDKWTGWTEASAVIGKGTLVGSNKKFNLTYIDYNDLEDRTLVNSDTNIKNFVKGLTGQKTSDDYKLYYTKEYDNETGTLYVDLSLFTLNAIINGTPDEVAGTGITYGIYKLLNIDGYESIELSYGDTKVTLTKADAKENTSYQAEGAITKGFADILKAIQTKGVIADVTIDVKFNLGEMYKESGTNNSHYSINFTSIVDLDENVRNLVADSSKGLSNNGMTFKLNNNTIEIMVDKSKEVSTIEGTGLINFLTALIIDPRVKQIDVADVVVSSTTSDKNAVAAQLKKALGDPTKLENLVGKTYNVKVELKDGLGVLDAKASNTTVSSRTYTIKFLGKVAQSTQDSLEKTITALSSDCDKTLDIKSGKNVYVIDVKNKSNLNKTVQTSGLSDLFTNAKELFKSIIVKIDGATYTIQNGSDDSGLITALNKKLSDLIGKDIIVRYNLKDNEVDAVDSKNVLTNNGYTEYTLKVRFVVDTNSNVSKAIDNANYGNKLKTSNYEEAAIDMSFDEKTKEITFELVHPNVSVTDLTSIIKGDFDTKLKSLLDLGQYSSIVVNYNGNDYTIKLTGTDDVTLSNELNNLLEKIASSTLNQIKGSDIKVTFNLNNGVMDSKYGDVKNITYTIKLSNKMSIKDMIAENLAFSDESNLGAKMIFNEKENNFYILYWKDASDVAAFESNVGNLIFTKLKALVSDERVDEIVLTIGSKTITIVSTSDETSLKTELENALKILVNDAKVPSLTIDDGKDVTFANLQKAININNLLSIKVALKNGYAVAAENDDLNYEYNVKLSKYINTNILMNSTYVDDQKLSFDIKHKVEYKVDKATYTSSDKKIVFKSESTNSIYSGLADGAILSVKVSGKKADAENYTNLITLTKESVKNNNGIFADSNKQLKYSIKDLIGIGKDAYNLADLIGYNFEITIELADGLRSENGNKVETYTINFVANE